MPPRNKKRKNSTPHLLSSSKHHYGLGFAISKKWTNLTAHKISDRVAILEGNLKGAHFKIVNCYEPTQILPNKKQEIYEEFLELLQANIKTKSNQILILQGDFNAKIGKSSIKSTHKDHFSTECENKNGSLLNEFLAINNLTATNTLFKHPARHLTTWQGKLNNKMVFLHNRLHHHSKKNHQLHQKLQKLLCYKTINRSQACQSDTANTRTPPTLEKT